MYSYVMYCSSNADESTTATFSNEGHFWMIDFPDTSKFGDIGVLQFNMSYHNGSSFFESHVTLICPMEGVLVRMDEDGDTHQNGTVSINCDYTNTTVSLVSFMLSILFFNFNFNNFSILSFKFFPPRTYELF